MSRAMKDSRIDWFGQVPDNWAVTTNKVLFNLYSGATPKTDIVDYWDGDIIWITPADYKTDDVFVSKGHRNITEAGLNSCGTVLLPPMSIVFSKRAPIGAVAVNAISLCTNQGCIGCVPNESVNYKFYYYCWSILTPQFEILGSGTTFKEISATSFANFKIIFPPLVEQEAIAEFLDRKCGEVDEMVALQEQVIEELKAYKQSVITEAVTKGLNPSAPMKPSNIDWIGQIPTHWEICRIKNKVGFNPGSTPPLRNIEVSYMPMECLRFDEIENRTAMYEDVKGYTPFAEGDIVMAKVTPCFENGNIAVATGLKNGIGFGTSEIFVIRCLQSCYTRYVLYFLRTPYILSRGVSSMTGTGGLKRVNPKYFLDSNLILPPLSEQQEIADYLDRKCADIDALIALKQHKIDDLREYKKSLIYEYVTGKKQTPNCVFH